MCQTEWDENETRDSELDPLGGLGQSVKSEVCSTKTSMLISGFWGLCCGYTGGCPCLEEIHTKAFGG